MLVSGSVLLGSIPSPSFNTIDIGPRPISLYGLTLGLGIVAATMLARSRLPQRRIHADTAVEMLTWVIPAGVVGARLYHVATDGVPFDRWIEIWKGGLGIPGAIAGGMLGAIAFIRSRGLPRAEVFDAVVPTLALAQAIGRWGNWWNQELYGGPTDLPWGLEIDSPLAGYEHYGTFHPTFLYESLWNLALCVGLIAIDRRRWLRPGRLVWAYVGGYAIGRLWIEALRIDPATEIAGLRVNHWIMGILLAISVVMLVRGRAQGGTRIEAADASDDDPDQSAEPKEATDAQ